MTAVTKCPDPTAQSLLAELRDTADAGDRLNALANAAQCFGLSTVADILKTAADQSRYQSPELSARWSGDIIALGHRFGAPAVEALGYMAGAQALWEQARYRACLTALDTASETFGQNGDEIGWARAQILRTAACMALARFDEGLDRACEARAILERAGLRVHVASIDTNLALLLERMNRPGEALVHSQRALDAYRDFGSDHRAVNTLSNHAYLLWRVGRVREALHAQRESHAGYVTLGAFAEAAREDANMGAAYLTLGYYTEAQRLLIAARRILRTAQSPFEAASAGLRLAECYLGLGRYAATIRVAEEVAEEYAAVEATTRRTQARVLKALALVGLEDHDTALQTLEDASRLLNSQPAFRVDRAVLDVSRAQLLVEGEKSSEARRLLEQSIPILTDAKLIVQASSARVLLGRVLLDSGEPTEAMAAAEEALQVAETAGLDWLAARAFHIRGMVERADGRQTPASEAFWSAMQRVDRVQRRVTWEDRVGFAATTAAIYRDAMTLALEQGRPTAALRYAERAKGCALTDHLKSGIDVRPRVRDEQTRPLVDELERLRERYAWLSAPVSQRTWRHSEAAGNVRSAESGDQDAEERAEARRTESRIGEIWHELQLSNPAYRGDLAALNLADDQEENTDDCDARWLANVQGALGGDAATALLEYVGSGDDLVLFVLRDGVLRALPLAGAAAAAQRLVAIFSMAVEHGAYLVSTEGKLTPGVVKLTRRLLSELYQLLLAPAAELLTGVRRLMVVPHGPTHHVPYHALYDGERYVLEQMEVAYAPSASLLEHFEERQRSLRANQTSKRQALVLACSAGGVLPHVYEEAAAVTAALGGRVFVNDEATFSALRTYGKDAAVVHVAAHGVFRPDEPLFSGLELGDGRLSTLDVFDLDLGCSLATLSACETSLGVTGAGDELTGLSRAFLYAGTPSLIVSLWKVEDRSTAALMTHLYRALSAGATKAGALRQAQLALLHGETDLAIDASGPYFWAPFRLMGHADQLRA